MKRLVLLSASIIMLLSACEKKEELAYVPSRFPTEKKVEKDYSFKIPYEKKGNNIYGTVNLTGTPLKGMFDTGCGIPLSISELDLYQALRNGTVITTDKPTKMKFVNADGSEYTTLCYKASYASFLDTEGQEHVIKDVTVAVRDDVSGVLIGLPLLQALGSSFEISDSESAILIRE